LLPPGKEEELNAILANYRHYDKKKGLTESQAQEELNRRISP
jgi:hypothetical protein